MTATEPSATGLLLRRASVRDAGAVADVRMASRRAAPMPPDVHSEPEVRGWLAGRLDEDEVWVAELEGVVVGYVRFTATWLDDLYVVPGAQGDGVGTALLDLVKAVRPDGFSLWVFESNLPARAFYSRRGLVERERTDGSGNEESEPDVRMQWPGPTRSHPRPQRTPGSVGGSP